MPISQVQRSGGKRKRDPLETIALGMQMAGSFVNISSGVNKMIQGWTGTGPEAKQKEAQLALTEAKTARVKAKTGAGIGGLEQLRKVKLSEDIVSGRRKEERAQKKELTISPKQTEALNELIGAVGTMKRIKEESKKYGDFIGPVAGRVPLVAREIDPTGLVKAPQEFFGFAADVEASFQKFRKFITGAQAAVKELGILRPIFPDIKNTPERFEAITNSRINESKRAMLDIILGQAAKGKTRGIPNEALALAQEQLESREIKPKITKKDESLLISLLGDAGKTLQSAVVPTAVAGELDFNNLSDEELDKMLQLRQGASIMR